ncbi:MAG: hypothetical protein IPJ19_13510 [Planctomycetes bacterium]|nr:hypothetical protein [Planctomycetota bacterium]
MARRLRSLLAGLCALALFLYVALALMRCVHPFELEWQEGGMLREVGRVLDGEALYAEPSFDYMAFPYTPLFVWLGAASTRLFGEGFLALRLVSLLASALCFFLVFRSAARNGGSRFAGWFAMGLFAASYRLCGAWFDVARVDSLWLVLVLAALEVLELRPSLVGAACAGTIFFGAFLAKQTALVPAGCVFLALAWRDARAALVFVLALGLPLLAGTWLADRQSDGWYGWYVFDLLRGHAWERERILGFWLELCGALAPVLALSVLAHFVGVHPPRPEGKRAPVHAFALAGLVLAAWLSRVHVGGYDNALMPAALAAALVFGPALASLLAAAGPVPVLASVLALLQLWLLRYDPRVQLPTRADVAAGELLVERLREVEGEVWVPDHGYLAELAGKESFAHGMSLVDLFNSTDHDRAQLVSDDRGRALEDKRFAVIVLEEDWSADLPALARNYTRTQIEYPEARTLVPVTGAPRRPRYWYARR